MKRVISLSLIFFTFATIISTITVNATQSYSENFNTNYTITGNGAEDIVSIALAQQG